MPERAFVSNGGTVRSIRQRISPAARQHAVRVGLAVDGIEGSGPGGRIILRDVVDLVHDPKAAGRGGRLERRPTVHRARPARPARPPLAQVNVTVRCRIDALLAQRAEFTDEVGEKIGLSALFVKALGLALEAVPAANVRIEDDRIVRHSSCNVAYIIADDAGQVAFPTIVAADHCPLDHIGRKLKAAAREQLERMSSGAALVGGAPDSEPAVATTAIANLGPGNIVRFETPVSPPHATVLAIASPELRLVPSASAQTGSKLPGWEQSTNLSCTLGCDSRLVSGLLAAKLLQAFQGFIERPERLFASVRK